MTHTVSFDYHRTVIGYHGTRRRIADELVNGANFGPSTNRDDWLGHGIYFWEYAPQQAWWWAERRYHDDAAVVGAMIRLGKCFDLCDPLNVTLIKNAHSELVETFTTAGKQPPKNAHTHKYLDCAVFNFFYKKLDDRGLNLESSRAVFTPLQKNIGIPRTWPTSGILDGSHIQLCVREPRNILAVWSVKKDGRYGRDPR